LWPIPYGKLCAIHVYIHTHNRLKTLSDQGKSVTALVVDRCAGCVAIGDLDFGPAAFEQLADLSVGRIFGVTWRLD
jgi:hypothetical protein